MEQALESPLVDLISETMRVHVGERGSPIGIGEGGCPRINWYGLRNELVAAIEAWSRRTPPAPSGAGAEIEAVADIAELVERLRGYVGSEFDNEAHLSGAEVEEVASSLATLQAEVERLTKERDEEAVCVAYAEGDFKKALDRAEAAETELAQLKQQLAERPGVRHFDILAEAMAEVKATSDGDSTQPIADIVAGCLAEIDALPDSRRARRTLSPSEREAGDA